MPGCLEKAPRYRQVSAARHRQEQGEGQAEPRPWNQQGLMEPKGAVSQVTALKIPQNLGAAWPRAPVV